MIDSLRILIVEDDPIQARLLQALLKNRGYGVVHADSAEKGLVLLQQQNIDLVMMDVELPGMNGYTATQRLREMDGDYWRPVMIVTANDSPEDWKKTSESGADDYLTKPVQFHQLVHKVAIMERLYRAYHMQQQSRKLHALGQMAAGVAHDFNNLLQVIKGNLQLLEEDLPNDNSNCRLTLEDISHAVDRGRDLVEHLNIYAAERTPELTPLNLHAWLTDYVARFKRLYQSELTILFKHRIPESVWIRANKVELNRMLDNLTKNARLAIADAIQESTDPDFHPCLTIGLSLAASETSEVTNMLELSDTDHLPQDARRVVLSVEDQGVGMTQETMERIFEPFFTTRDVWQGFGLGLPQVQSMMRRHYGSVEVSSQPGEGSCFRLLFPLLIGYHTGTQSQI